MRRMEDRIRGLCKQILAAKDDEQIGSITLELRAALRQHIACLRERAADYPLMLERRVRDGLPPPDPPAPELEEAGPISIEKTNHDKTKTREIEPSCNTSQREAS